ncbi:hypothetical protein KIV40_29945, partial [Vibrio sp. D173a]|nr:hypothetical protein [Vibrio sp. D173a]
MKHFDSNELLIGSIVLLVGILIGSFWLGNTSEWATPLGSLGTAGTLIFLIFQNIELRKRQDAEQNQQDEIWKEQKEMLHFQKYQEHKKAFLEHIDYLESLYTHKLHFKHKSSLYSKVFPLNSFENCQSSIDELESSSALKNLLELSGKIDDNLYSQNICYQSLFNNILDISNILGLDIVNDKLGTIEISDKVELDFFDPTVTIDMIKHIIVQIIDFARLTRCELPQKRYKNIRSNWIKVQLQLLEPCLEAKLTTFTLRDIDNSNEQIFILALAWSYLDNIDEQSDKQLALNVKLFSLFFDRGCYSELTLNEHNLNSLLNEIWCTFEQLSEETTDTKTKEWYFILSKAARFNVLGKMLP